MTEFCCPPVTGSVLDEEQAAELASVLKALADPARIRLVSLVAAAGEACACDLPEQLGRSQSTVSHHLTQLVKVGILEREQRGKWAWFRLRPERLAAVCAALGGSAAADVGTAGIGTAGAAALGALSGSGAAAPTAARR